MYFSSAPHEEKPLAPLDRLPNARLMPGIGFSWWLPQKALLVTQTTQPHATVAGCTAFHDLIDELLARHKNAVEAAGGMAFLHDWRTVTSSDDGLREEFVRRIRQRPRGYQRSVILVLKSDNTAMHMAVMAGNAVAALATGRRIQITGDANAALAEVGLG